MRVVAPGKLVLLGEYAVLRGAPAVACAVDRGVGCTVTAADAPSWATPGDDRFVAAALADAPAAHYAFDAANPVGSETKVGFGHSAAATVAALYGAGLRGNELHRRAAAVHLEVQGNGSGIDIAAAVHGGVFRFEAGRVTPLPPVDPVVIWSGTSAATGPRVAHFEAWCAAYPQGATAFDMATRSAVMAFERDPVEAVRANRRSLLTMAESSRLDYRTPALDAICDAAENHGGAAKPSGAGGGDCAVALFGDPDARAAYIESVTTAGFTVIPVSIAPGAQEET